MPNFSETRSMLKKAAVSEAGPSSARNAYHNMLEQTENLTKLGEWPHQKLHLAASVELEQRRLAGIKRESCSCAQCRGHHGSD